MSRTCLIWTHSEKSDHYPLNSTSLLPQYYVNVPSQNIHIKLSLCMQAIQLSGMRTPVVFIY